MTRVKFRWVSPRAQDGSGHSRAPDANRYGAPFSARCAHGKYLKSEVHSNLPAGRSFAVMEMGSAGPMTLARREDCGKSLGFKVTRKSALPSSAHKQNGSSLGSGEIAIDVEGCIISASSRNRLMITPIKLRRTPKRARISLYSRSISSVMSQVNLPSSIQFLMKRALGLRRLSSGDLNPATPATRTDVSTTPLGCFPFWRFDNCDLRQLFPRLAIIGNLSRDLLF